jgi:hypothetical protein
MLLLSEEPLLLALLVLPDCDEAPLLVLWVAAEVAAMAVMATILTSGYIWTGLSTQSALRRTRFTQS